VTVYVLDTGIETSHWEFGGRAWAGYDALGGSGEDCHGHGTHVAGTVGGAYYGVATSVGLVSVRVLDCNNFGSWSGVIAGIDWVAYSHATPAVANLSLWGGGSQAVDDAISNLIASGVTVVVIAGNNWGADACNYSPARVAEALTVAASNSSDQQASFSNAGSCVDLYAPGEGITSAWLYGGTNTIDGTSMAAPHVAGAAALYLQDNPGASPTAVSSVILNQATSGRLSGLGSGSPNRLLYTHLSGTVAPPASRTAIHRLFSQSAGDHLYGLDPYEGAQSGYALEARDYFYLPSAPTAGHVPLYRCYQPQPYDHFLSTAANCEGATSEGLLGYIATSQVAGTVPLYRLYRSATTNTFYTLSADEADQAVAWYGYTRQGVTGYVYLTPTPPTTGRTPIHRLWSQSYGDHLYGLYPNEGAQMGYVLNAQNYFYLEPAAAAGHVPLYRCFRGADFDHFLSTQATCEGATNEGLQGYIATSQVAGTVPMYRLYRSATTNTFYTLSADEADQAVAWYGYTRQGVTGYVYLTP
jgi:aqualysin 1